MVKMLIDVDTGVDDSIALLYALNHPEVEIVGITTGCGNVDAVQAAENTVRIIELSNTKKEIPVVVGANQPLNGTWEVTIVTLGRLTNIAMMVQKYPESTKLVKNLVMMGGTVNAPGNVSPVAEANIAGDPEACDQVFLTGMDITVVGLDVTLKTRLRKKHVEQMETYCSERCKPAVQYMKKALEYYMNGSRVQNYTPDNCPLHDPLAMVAAVVPSIVKIQKRKARVECSGTYCRGMIVTDLREKPIEAEYISFALEVDAERAINELMSVFWRE